MVKNLPADAGHMRKRHGSGRPPEKGNGNPLCILAWRIPWTAELGMLRPIRLQRVGYNYRAHTKFVKRYKE